MQMERVSTNGKCGTWMHGSYVGDWRHVGRVPRSGCPRPERRVSRDGNGLMHRLEAHVEPPGKDLGQRDYLYVRALDCARRSRFEKAEELFEELLSCHPEMCKAWVSYAQVMSSRVCMMVKGAVDDETVLSG